MTKREAGEAIQAAPDPGGDRVRITLDGKFLPYEWG
jgi:cyanate lyase